MSSWRDQQINNIGRSGKAILHQETYLMDFLQSLCEPRIFWTGRHTNLLKIIADRYSIVENIKDADTLVLLDSINNLTIEQTQQIIKSYLAMENIKNLYVGINRYAFKVLHLDITLPDSMSESIDHILKSCHAGFRRIAEFDDISGNTFVFSHPMDLYTLCR